MASVWETLIRAALLARSTGASEIGIDTLLAAIEVDSVPAESIVPPPDQAFLPAPHQDFPFSATAAAAIESAGDLETMSVERLRAALLAAKE